MGPWEGLACVQVRADEGWLQGAGRVGQGRGLLPSTCVGIDELKMTMEWCSQVSTCLLPPLSPADTEAAGTAGAEPGHQHSRSHDHTSNTTNHNAAAQDASRRRKPLPQQPGLRLRHCAVAPAAAAAAVAAQPPAAVAAAAAERLGAAGLKALAADVAQGLLMVVDYESGAIMYLNHSAEAYMVRRGAWGSRWKVEEVRAWGGGQGHLKEYAGEAEQWAPHMRAGLSPC